jgi:hypothetical protein
MNNNYFNQPFPVNNQNKERHNTYQNNPSTFLQTTKTLTFATVKGNAHKPKDGTSYQETSSFINIQEQKKPTIHVPKNNVLMV